MATLPVQHFKDHVQAKKRETKAFSRVHGVCNPCKLAKIKCDRAIPCGSCRSEKRKPRTCEYSEKAQGIARARQEAEARQANRHGSRSADPEESDPRDHQVPNAVSHPSEPRQRAPHTSTSPGLIHRRLSLYKVVDEFIRVKPVRPQQAQLHIHNVQNLWAELQEFLFKGRESTSMLPLQAISNDASSAVTDCERADGLVDILDRRRTQLNGINEQICIGNLANAWISIPPLMRAMEIWEISYEENPSQDADDLHHEVASIYGRLLELDSILSFFLGGQSLLLPAWQRLNSVRPKVEYSIDTKIEVFRAISQVLEIDTSDEFGVWRFLQFHQSIKSADPATPLEKVATCTTDKEPFEAQEMKLFSNLLFVVIHCRTASICSYYSQSDCPLPPENTGIGNAVREMKLNNRKQRGLECAMAIKHAGNVIDAFEALYEIDKESLAKSWLLLYGGLMATVLYQINGLREKGGDWDTCKETINRIRDRFSDLKGISSALPPLDKAIAILAERNPRKPQASGTPKTKSRPNLRHGVSTAAPDEGNEESQKSKQRKPAMRRKPQPRRKRSIDEVAGFSSSARSKLSKTIYYEYRNPVSANSSFDGYDRAIETRHDFGYGDTLPVHASQYDPGFGTEFGGHAPFASSATTSSAIAVPQQVDIPTPQPPAPQSRGWENSVPHVYWHPPLAFPHEWMQNGLPTELGTDHLQILEDTMPPSAPMQPFLPSPSHGQPLAAAEQAPVTSASESSNFYHTPSQQFEQRHAEDVMSGLARPRNSQLLRRPSEPVLSLRESVVAPRQWHDDREHGTTQMLGSEYHPPMLPPTPEMVWLQSDHCGALPQGAYYPVHGQHYVNQHEAPYAITDPAVADHNNMHQMSQQHNHYYQSTTMSS